MDTITSTLITKKEKDIMPTLKELDVQEGDVVKAIGGLFQIRNTKGELRLWCMKNKSWYLSVKDSVSDYTLVSRASSSFSKTWGEMNDVEKGALLLAHHEGKQIQFKGQYIDEWSYTIRPSWSSGLYYRVKPAPEIVPVTILHKVKEQTHTITFNLINDVPDCASIKMCALN